MAIKKINYSGSSKVIKRLCEVVNGLIDRGAVTSLAQLTDVDLDNLTNAQIIKYNSTTEKWENADESGGGGGGELVDIFNGASTVSLASYNGITLISSSVTDLVGTASMSEWSNGYEGFNIALQNLVVGKMYTLKFKFRVTSGAWFSNMQYRFGYMLTDTNRSDYSNYTQWSENLDRDLNEHSHSVDFTATATTMYLSFNICGFSDSVTNYYTISELCVKTMGGSGSTVSYSQTLSSGTETGEITIDGVAKKMYAPTAPTKVSDLQNDEGFVKDSDLATVATSGDASDVAYDNTTSGLTADDVQEAIDELKGDIPTDFVSKVNGGTFESDITIDNRYGGFYGNSLLTLGNDLDYEEHGNSRGHIRLYGGLQGFTMITPADSTQRRDIDLPDKSGTVALLDDLTTFVSDNPTFTEAQTRANIASGESFATILGKIKKWFTDIPDMFVSKSGDTMKGNFTVDRQNGTTAAVGYTNFTIGNNIAEGTEKNSQGAIRIYSNTAYRAEIQADNLTNNRAFYLPNKGGTIALTSDVFYADDRKIINISLDGTSASVNNAVQDVLNAINTEGKYCYVRALHFKSGARYLSGYIYPNKNYGSFILQDWLHCYFCSIDNGSISHTQII